MTESQVQEHIKTLTESFVREVTTILSEVVRRVVAGVLASEDQACGVEHVAAESTVEVPPGVSVTAPLPSVETSLVVAETPPLPPLPLVPSADISARGSQPVRRRIVTMPENAATAITSVYTEEETPVTRPTPRPMRNVDFELEDLQDRIVATITARPGMNAAELCRLLQVTEERLASALRPLQEDLRLCADVDGEVTRYFLERSLPFSRRRPISVFPPSRERGTPAPAPVVSVPPPPPVPVVVVSTSSPPPEGPDATGSGAGPAKLVRLVRRVPSDGG